jgi:hypothetical protein
VLLLRLLPPQELPLQLVPPPVRLPEPRLGHLPQVELAVQAAPAPAQPRTPKLQPPNQMPKSPSSKCLTIT